MSRLPHPSSGIPPVQADEVSLGFPGLHSDVPACRVSGMEDGIADSGVPSHCGTAVRAGKAGAPQPEHPALPLATAPRNR